MTDGKVFDVRTYFLKEDGAIPNNDKLPLLVYAGALRLPDKDPAATCEVLFRENGWGRSWRNGIYGFHHYHSTAHEVLGVYRGTAKVQFGGDNGTLVTVEAGDVIIIPAGVAHKNMGSSRDFGVVGAYPGGQDWDMNYGKISERSQADKNIAQVALPQKDPVFGSEGPLREHWSKL